MTKLPFGLPPIIAHRGAAADAPENTLAAFRRAAALGATWVELDATIAACGTPVVFHDDTLPRTTNGSGRLVDTPADVLTGLDAGSWFDPAFAGEPVPTLDAAIDCLVACGLGLNCELKIHAGRSITTARTVVARLVERWPSARLPLLISSFDTDALRAAADVAPNLPRGLLLETPVDDWRARMDALGAATLHVGCDHLDDAALARLAGADLLTYTVNDAATARRLLANGVKAVISDHADLLIAPRSCGPHP